MSNKSIDKLAEKRCPDCFIDHRPEDYHKGDAEAFFAPSEIERLKAVNAELLEACRKVESVLRGRDQFAWFPVETRLQVQDAIKKAEGR